MSELRRRLHQWVESRRTINSLQVRLHQPAFNPILTVATTDTDPNKSEEHWLRIRSSSTARTEDTELKSSLMHRAPENHPPHQFVDGSVSTTLG